MVFIVLSLKIAVFNFISALQTSFNEFMKSDRSLLMDLMIFAIDDPKDKFINKLKDFKI